MRDNLKRINIVLTKEQHVRFKNYSKRFHGSLSQFIRLAAENEIDDSEKMEALYIRPIMSKLDKLDDELLLVKHAIEEITSNMRYNIEKKKIISDNIFDLLSQSNKPLSVPDMIEYLPFQQQDIVDGIEELLDTFSLLELPKGNSPSKWKIRGDNNEKSNG